MRVKQLSLLLLLALSGIVLITACKKKENDPPAPADKPTALEGKEIHRTNFLASWNTINGANGYKIDVSAGAGFSTMVQGFSGKDVKTSDWTYVFGLNGNTKYYYRVRAYVNETDGGNSNVVEVTTNSEDQLPNMDFENWTAYLNYEDPAPRGIWATPNKIVDLLPGFYPASVVKTTDAVSGQYAAMMFTDSVQGLPLITGTVATGIFEVNLQDPVNSLIQGMPYTSKPTAFRGFYKYMQVDGDSCDVYAQLTRWNSTLALKEVLAEAKLPHMPVYPDTYTEFNLPFIYFSDLTPDSLIVIFASSAAGDFFVGGIGSTLYVDDISLVFSDK